MGLQKLTAVFGVALLSMGAMAATASDGKMKRTKSAPLIYVTKSELVVTDELKKQLFEFIQLRKALFLPAQVAPKAPCQLQQDTTCVINVDVVLVGPSNEYCVALFPEKVSLANTQPGNSEKKIVWSLNLLTDAAASGATFTFFDDKNSVGKAPGVIVLSDKKNQFHSPKLGDGTVSTPDPMKFHVKNKHRVVGSGVYLPIVVRTDGAGTSSEKVSACGTPDPTIAND